jgi:hypothetical protein
MENDRFYWLIQINPDSFDNDLGSMHLISASNQATSRGREEGRMSGERRPKIVTDVPDPPVVDTQVLEVVLDEAREWRESYVAQTAPMEEITPSDLKVRAK